MPDPRNRIQWNATVKAYPAIADLQAPSGFVRVLSEEDDVGAPTYDQDIYTVPADKIFVLEFLMGVCVQADPGQIDFVLRSGGTDYTFYTAAYGGALEEHRWTIPIKFDENEIVRIHWVGTLATTDVVGMLFGYLVDKY